jgi:DNA adenine methylase
MTNPIVCWPGGKRRLAAQIYPHFPAHTCYVEPFAGAAALLMLREKPAKVEVINDVNRDLVCLYRVVQHHLEEFCRQFKWALVSRQMFAWLKSTETASLTDIQRAARFFYLQQLAFGGKVEGRNFGVSTTSLPGLNLLRIEEHLSQVHLRLANVIIECLSWHECISRYDRPYTLFFCDPPYLDTMGYDCPFGIEQYEQLAQAMAESKGRFVLTVNDHPEMRRIFGKFKFLPLETTYSIGRTQESKAKPRHELLFLK